jgi:hypothetical protein
VQAGEQHPQQAQKAEDQERVVEPQPPARIDHHRTHVLTNKRSVASRRLAQTRNTLMACALLALLAGCLPDPQQLQSVTLLDQLTSARAMFGQQPVQADLACNMVGDVQTRLYGEPGLVEVRPAWQALDQAAEALQAVCGQHNLLDQASTNTPTELQARQRWQAGMRREIGIACDHLREAASALGRPTPC